MSRWSVRARARAVVAAGAVVVLLSGCTQEIPGLGRYASRRPVANAKINVNGSTGEGVDIVAGNAIADIQQYWTDQLPKVFGEKYEPVKAFYSIDPDGNRPAPCTDNASDIRGNAFYCPSRDIVAWDRKGLFPELQQRFDPFLITMVLAHEWGHVIQRRTKLPSNRTIVVEAQADCYAGAFTAYALKGSAPHQDINRQTLDKALSGYLLFRDPVGADQDDRQAHGSGFDRIGAFQDGFEKGPKFCATFSDSRTFTQVGFSNSTDRQNKGNLPFADTIKRGPKDVDKFWAASFAQDFGGAWRPLKGGARSYTPTSRPQCSGTPVTAVAYCASEDAVYYDTEALRSAYNKTEGDFGPISLVAVAYGYAVQERRGRSIDPDSEAAYTGAICLAGGYAKDSFQTQTQQRLQLSPGDLDEAIRALLDLAGTRDFTRTTQTTGFDRVQAFRTGFDDVRSCT
jgi:predicted metalloprotease